MPDSQNEKLSLLIDDELDARQSLELLESLENDENLQRRLHRYQLISQTIKSEPVSVAGSDFVQRVHQQLQKEPVYFLPQYRKNADLARKAAWALAASVLLATVWFANQRDLSMLPLASVGVIAQTGLGQPGDAGLDHARFKAYLQAHDNALYANTAPIVQPYARVVGYRQQ